VSHLQYGKLAVHIMKKFGPDSVYETHDRTVHQEPLI